MANPNSDRVVAIYGISFGDSDDMEYIGKTTTPVARVRNCVRERLRLLFRSKSTNHRLQPVYFRLREASGVFQVYCLAIVKDVTDRAAVQLALDEQILKYKPKLNKSVPKEEIQKYSITNLAAQDDHEPIDE